VLDAWFNQSDLPLADRWLLDAELLGYLMLLEASRLPGGLDPAAECNCEGPGLWCSTHEASPGAR
jgi:hypothetical protein